MTIAQKVKLIICLFTWLLQICCLIGLWGAASDHNLTDILSLGLLLFYFHAVSIYFRP